MPTVPRFKAFGALIPTLAALLLTPHSNLFAQQRRQVPPSVEAKFLEAIQEQVAGRDRRFFNWAAPAQYNVPPQQQNAVDAASRRIASEAAQVYEAFASAQNGLRTQVTLEKLRTLSPETARDRAARTFPDNLTPPASWIRQIAFIPITSLAANPVASVFKEVTAFDLLPKPDDTFYAYTNTFDLRGGFTELSGSRRSHLAPNLGLTVGTPVAVKKCRNVFLLGPYCNTVHHLAREISLSGDDGGESARLAVTTLINLNANTDDPGFAARGRNENTAMGYTALTLVARAGDTVLVYFAGIQHSDRIPPIPNPKETLNEGHKEEAQQLVDRLRLNLKIPVSIAL